MNTFHVGLLTGAVVGFIVAASVYAQFGTTSNSAFRPPEAMSIEQRRQVLERCDSMPIGPAKDQCMDDLMVNKNAAQAAQGQASRIGDGRTGAPGIGWGPSSVSGEAAGPARGARTSP